MKINYWLSLLMIIILSLWNIFFKYTFYHLLCRNCIRIYLDYFFFQKHWPRNMPRKIYDDNIFVEILEETKIQTFPTIKCCGTLWEDEEKSKKPEILVLSLQMWFNDLCFVLFQIGISVWFNCLCNISFPISISSIVRSLICIHNLLLCILFNNLELWYFLYSFYNVCSFYLIWIEF